MVRTIIVCAVLAVALASLIGLADAYEGEDDPEGVDPCEICIEHAIPWACRLCDLETWWMQENTPCLPGEWGCD